MNIFVLDLDPAKIPILMCDQHVVKMILETAQLLSTTLNKSGLVTTYKPTHINHPCTIWVRSSYSNYMWLLKHFNALLQEYKYRYEKDHTCAILLKEFTEYSILLNVGLTNFALAMPDILKLDNDPVMSYQIFYAYKHVFRFKMRFTKRKIPQFIIKYSIHFISLVIILYI